VGEEASQAERMLGLGCTYGQGYFFSRPVSGDTVAKLFGATPARETRDGATAATRAVRIPRPAPSVDVSPA
jgi:predicted signal transduction protein with EAL and GGDEF domain